MLSLKCGDCYIFFVAQSLKINLNFAEKKKALSAIYFRVYDKKKLILWASFTTEEYAARNRDLFIMFKLPDSHYKLNFEWSEQDKNEWKIKLNYN